MDILNQYFRKCTRNASSIRKHKLSTFILQIGFFTETHILLDISAHKLSGTRITFIMLFESLKRISIIKSIFNSLKKSSLFGFFILILLNNLRKLNSHDFLSMLRIKISHTRNIKSFIKRLLEVNKNLIKLSTREELIK